MLGTVFETDCKEECFFLMRRSWHARGKRAVLLDVSSFMSDLVHKDTVLMESPNGGWWLSQRMGTLRYNTSVRYGMKWYGYGTRLGWGLETISQALR